MMTSGRNFSQCRIRIPDSGRFVGLSKSHHGGQWGEGKLRPRGPRQVQDVIVLLIVQRDGD